MKGIKEEGLQPKQPGIWVLSNYQCCFKMKGAKMSKTPATLLGAQKTLNMWKVKEKFEPEVPAYKKLRWTSDTGQNLPVPLEFKTSCWLHFSTFTKEDQAVHLDPFPTSPSIQKDINTYPSEVKEPCGYKNPKFFRPVFSIEKFQWDLNLYEKWHTF